MFGLLLSLFRRIVPGLSGSSAGNASEAEPQIQGIDELNRHAPLHHAEASTGITTSPTLLCREPLLGRDQRIAGYRFVLRESTRNRIRRSSHVVHHVYAEVLISNLLDAGVLHLLEHRLAVIEVPDTFLGHETLLRFPTANTVFAIECIYDNAADSIATLVAHAASLRARGYRIGFHASTPEEIPTALMPLVDLVLTDSTGGDPGDIRRLFARLRQRSPTANIAAIDLATVEEFQYLHGLGASYFHGPFVTRREQWSTGEIGAEVLKVRPLIEALRSDAPNDEIVAQTQRNPAIVLRLLRHANSAAFHTGREITSIDHAIQLVGRTQLLRWLMLVLLSGQVNDGRAHAALETAMVRGRTLELLAKRKGEAGNLFLVGLLSLVDVVFRVDMPRALDALGVAGHIRDAITDNTGPYAQLLKLAIAWENGDSEHIQESAQNCGISVESTAEAYMQALWWALEAPE